MLAGRIVEPDEPTCRIPNMPVFKVGFWNGLYHSSAMLRELANNFRAFMNYRPYGSINHKDELACGRVNNVRFDGQTLFLDVGNLPESVGKAWNAGFLHSPSIEYWDTRENVKHGLTSGFRNPDGSLPGLVLRCVTLCGNGAPAVKTLGPMPKAVYEGRAANVEPATERFDNWRSFGDSRFTNIDPASRRFTSEDFMDKAAMIASLKAAQPWLTDELLNSMSDQQLAMMLDGAQGASAAGAVDDATAGGGDLGGALGGAAAGGMPGGGAAPAGPDVASAGEGGDAGPDFEKMMSGCDTPQKMMDLTTKILNDTLAKNKSVRTLESKLKALDADTTKKVGSIVDQKIRAFMDGPASMRIPPAQRPIVEKLLRKCDAHTVRKFSDGKGTGSELDEQMAEILRQYPVQTGFVRQFSDTGTAGAAAGGREYGDARLENTLRMFKNIPEMEKTLERVKTQHAIAN